MHTAIATDLVNAVDCPQVFTFLTDTFPVDVPHVHVILVVPCPAVITAPVGTDHDCVSPVTEGVVNTKPVWFGHELAGPVMLAGVAGTAVSVVLRDDVAPQELVTVTDNVPDVKELGMLSEMDVPVFDTIVQPVGTVQLYEVAPATDVME
jgi:hypothetical protein